jgi:hypothetical protein
MALGDRKAKLLLLLLGISLVHGLGSGLGLVAGLVDQFRLTSMSKPVD